MTLLTVSASRKLAVTARIRECLSLAASQGVVLAMPAVRYDLKGAKSGVSNWLCNELRFNPVLLNENLEYFVHQTVGHEVAHLIAHRKFGARIKPHGREWRAVMGSLGLEPERCHSYDVTNVRKNATAYRCNCGVHNLSVRQHANMPEAQYQCAKCKGFLTLASSTEEPGSPTSARALAGSSPVPPHRRPVPPTAGMVSFAKELSKRRDVVLPLVALTSYAACASFLDQLKQVSGVPANPPTPQQLKLVSFFTKTTKAVPPAYVIADKWLLSLWIIAQAKLTNPPEASQTPS